MQSLKKRFKFDDEDGVSKEEFNRFISSLLNSTLDLNHEVKIVNGAHSNMGKSIVKLCRKYFNESETKNPSEIDQAKQNNMNVFKKPYKREYILRCSVPRPAPYSSKSPQRMYCLLTNNEFRIAGAFTEDTMFF
jgi:Rab3 GTPase-activating protein catalytic subunit